MPASTHVIGPRPCAVCGGLLVTTVRRLIKPDYTCIYCARKNHLEWTRKNREHMLAVSRKFYSDPENRARAKVRRKAYIKRNRLKINARVRVMTAVKSGRLTRGPCAVCGTPEASAHHEDYSKPLEVIWLCSPCHFARHVQRADFCHPVIAVTASVDLIASLPEKPRPRSLHHKRFFKKIA